MESDMYGMRFATALIHGGVHAKQCVFPGLQNSFPRHRAVSISRRVSALPHLSLWEAAQRPSFPTSWIQAPSATSAPLTWASRHLASRC